MTALRKRLAVLEEGTSAYLSYEESLRRLLNPSAFPGRVHDPRWIDGLARMARS